MPDVHRGSSGTDTDRHRERYRKVLMREMSLADALVEASDDTFAVGDAVRYKEWPGVIREVLCDGTVYIGWTGLGPYPYFYGPYKPHELTREAASV